MGMLYNTTVAMFFYASEPSSTNLTGKNVHTEEPHQIVSSITPEAALQSVDVTTAQAAPTTQAAGTDIGNSDADIAVSQLIKMKTLKKDWDGYGAAEPIAASIQLAHNFIRRLAPESVVPKPSLHADGHVILFHKDGKRYAEIEFFADGTIGCFVKQGSKTWGDTLKFDGSTLSQELQNVGLSLA